MGEEDRKPTRNKLVEKSREKLKDFPTLVRYGGVVLMFYAAIVDRGQNPALIPAATGMIFFKNVAGS